MSRIMMIAPHFEEYSHRLACALGKDADVMLLLRTDVLDAEYEGRRRPDTPRVTLHHNAFRSPGDLIRIFRAILRFRPDVVHWQEPSGLIKAVMAAIVTTVARPFTRTALTIHDPVPHGGRDAAIARRLARFRRYTRKRVHRIFVHGPTCRDQYLNDYCPAPHRDDRVRLTEHGVIQTGPDLPPPAGFSPLMFGRMEAYKGLEILCQAAETLSQEGHPMALRVMGAGAEMDRLETRLRALPNIRVENGFAPSIDLIAAIGASDCVVLPYLSATQSGVLAAAFGNGRFVIASRTGGIVDIIEEGVNGLLVEPGNAKALADALRMVSTDAALRKRLCEGARRTAIERLDWHNISSSLLSNY